MPRKKKAAAGRPKVATSTPAPTPTPSLSLADQLAMIEKLGFTQAAELVRLGARMRKAGLTLLENPTPARPVATPAAKPATKARKPYTGKKRGRKPRVKPTEPAPAPTETATQAASGTQPMGFPPAMPDAPAAAAPSDLMGGDGL